MHATNSQLQTYVNQCSGGSTIRTYRGWRPGFIADNFENTPPPAPLLHRGNKCSQRQRDERGRVRTTTGRARTTESPAEGERGWLAEAGKGARHEATAGSGGGARRARFGLLQESELWKDVEDVGVITEDKFEAKELNSTAESELRKEGKPDEAVEAIEEAEFKTKEENATMEAVFIKDGKSKESVKVIKAKQEQKN